MENLMLQSGERTLSLNAKFEWLACSTELKRLDCARRKRSLCRLVYICASLQSAAHKTRCCFTKPVSYLDDDGLFESV